MGLYHAASGPSKYITECTALDFYMHCMPMIDQLHEVPHHCSLFVCEDSSLLVLPLQLMLHAKYF